jgi:hypothetical protein
MHVYNAQRTNQKGQRKNKNLYNKHILKTNHSQKYTPWKTMSTIFSKSFSITLVVEQLQQ